MFRRFIRDQCVTRSSTTASTLQRQKFDLFFLATTNTTTTPTLLSSCANITTNEFMTKLNEYQSQFSVNKNPIVKRDAAELIEKEVLTDVNSMNTNNNDEKNTNNEDTTTAAVTGDDDEGKIEANELLKALSESDAQTSPLLARPPSIPSDAVVAILSSAATFGVNLLEPCHAVSTALRWCVELPRIEEELMNNNNTKTDNENNAAAEEEYEFLLDPAASAKVLQSLIQMQHPHMIEVFVSWIPRIERILPRAEAPAVVSLAHAYGRTGTIHRRLVAALERRAIETLSNTQLIAQVANSFYAFAQLQSKNEELYRVLAARALDLLPQASPIVITTIIDSIATSGVPQPELLEFYEKLAAAKMKDATPPIVASLMFGVARCHNPSKERTDSEGAAAAARSPVITGGCERVTQIADNFDAASGAKLLQSLVIANIVDENILTVVADRITNIAGTCKLEECATILRSIAQFELYDDALFNAIAKRAIYLIRGSGSGGGSGGGGRSGGRGARFSDVSQSTASSEHVASILCSFAMVSQPHSDLFSACSNVVKYRASQLTSSELIDLMWAFVVLGEHLRHEPIFLTMQTELKRREATVNTVEREMIKSHPRYETAMVVLGQ